MAALRSSPPVVYALAPCEMPCSTFVVHETGPAEAPRPRPLDRVHQSGQKGTKQLLAQYGDRLVCVRYRYDAQRKTRFKTVELIAAQRDWDPRAPPLADDALVAVRVGFAEVELRHQVKQAGGKWDTSRKVWELRHA